MSLRRMGLWRVEWLRLVRTGRWIALAAVFLLLGLGEPLLTRYLGHSAARVDRRHRTSTSPSPGPSRRTA